MKELMYLFGVFLAYFQIVIKARVYMKCKYILDTSS